MKVLVCGNDSETAAVAEAAVYDAGCMPVGPVGNALRALGLADQECPAAALIDLSAVDDGNGLWLAEKLAERGIDIVCISDRRAGSHGLAIRRHVSVCKPTDREALIDCLESLRCDGAARRRPAAGDSSRVSAF
jgi:hypothetical protein